MRIIFSTILGFALTSFAAEPEPWRNFNDYWYQGKAEVNRYELSMARYGELRKGNAILIFVTEDFLPDIQVKHESGDHPSLPVMKLNTTRTFNTGLYPYSFMTSIFTHVDFNEPTTLKTSTSVQEWCGHTYLQFNRQNGHLVARSHSYFQSEGDEQIQLESARLEDSLWTIIRIDPEKLPTGDLDLVPASQYLRLRHVKPAVYKANAERSTVPHPSKPSVEVQVYHLTYRDLDRELKIFFQTASPHQIVGWEESYTSGFGPNKKTLTSTGTLTHTMFTDYWNKNKNSDEHLREDLGLMQ